MRNMLFRLFCSIIRDSAEADNLRVLRICFKHWPKVNNGCAAGAAFIVLSSPAGFWFFYFFIIPEPLPQINAERNK